MTRAILLTSQRSGSTFLQQCLVTHPDICSAGEILIDGGKVGPDARPILKSRLLTRAYYYLTTGAWHPTLPMRAFFAQDHERVRIFKAMYNHIKNPWTLKFLLRDKAIRVLHLRRRNLLKQYVSRARMSKLGFWPPHVFAPVKVEKIVIVPAQAIAFMRQTQNQFLHYERLFADHPRLSLVYEDMIDGHALSAEASREICGFLGVETRTMHSRLVKIGSSTIASAISNYSELAAAVRRTEFADLLDDH